MRNGTGLAWHVAGDSGRGDTGSSMPEEDFLRAVDQILYSKFRPGDIAARLTNLGSGLLGTDLPSAMACLFAAYDRVGWPTLHRRRRTLFGRFCCHPRRVLGNDILYSKISIRLPGHLVQQGDCRGAPGDDCGPVSS